MDDDVRHFVLKVCSCVKSKKPHIVPVEAIQSIYHFQYHSNWLDWTIYIWTPVVEATYIFSYSQITSHVLCKCIQPLTNLPRLQQIPFITILLWDIDYLKRFYMPCGNNLKIMFGRFFKLCRTKTLRNSTMPYRTNRQINWKHEPDFNINTETTTRPTQNTVEKPY